MIHDSRFKTGARLPNPLSRRMVFCCMGLSLTSGKYCLGYCLRDKGQRRVPELPAIMTGQILNSDTFMRFVALKLF